MIGKTRQSQRSGPSPASASGPNPTFRNCGDLIPVSADWHRHLRFAPAPVLAEWIEHLWLESWRLPANTQKTRELLPHPCVQLAFSLGRASIYGVQQGRFIRTYVGEGCVFGVRFRAGAFFPFFRKSVSSLSNRSVAAETVFPDALQAATAIFKCRSPAEMVGAATEFLTAIRPQPDPNLSTLSAMIDTIVGDRKISRVHHMVSRFGITERSLQRLFRCYVGASPRWVIKRYRAYEALLQLNSVQPQGLSAVAQELGYFDQAHFANDFRNRVGKAPSEFTEHALNCRCEDAVDT